MDDDDDDDDEEEEEEDSFFKQCQKAETAVPILACCLKTNNTHTHTQKFSMKCIPYE
jgi:hypothetical protein